MGRKAGAIQAQAQQIVAQTHAALARIDEALGAYPFRRRETPAETMERAPLLAEQASLSAQASQAQAVAVQAGQLYSEIAERRRVGFSARILERTSPPFSPDFWTSIGGSAGADLDRLGEMLDDVGAAAIGAPEPRGAFGLVAGLVIAFGLAFPIRRLLDRIGRRTGQSLSTRQAADTLAIAWRVGVDVALPTLAAAAVRFGAQWGGLLAPAADELAGALVGSIAWGAAVVALGRALAAAETAQDRLLPIDDRAADRARASLWIVAVITAAGFLVQRVNYVIGASVASTIAANCVVSLAYAVTAAFILVTLGRQGEPPAGASAAERARAPAWTLISLTLAAAIVATVGAVLCGYTTLAALISGQIFWLSLIGGSAFLLLRVIDDVFAALFNRNGKAAGALHRLFGLRTTTIAQIGLLIAAGLQLVVIVAAVMLAITPFGGSGELLMAHAHRLGADIHVGKATISPAGLVGGVATLLVGVGLSHLVRLWVTRRYLPATDWDAGVRNSVSTGVAYLGVAIAIASALAVTGLGLQQIALVASALSVGIGFGLQQIVQNFVAGVILLIERPVQVGDWINVGGVEGDVVNIRVRATEIRASDCSTIIVPNSSLITTNVQNKTLGEPRGRIELKLSVAKSEDVPKAREALVALAGQRPEILTSPAPTVVIDGLAAAGGANLIAWVYVADPRQTTAVRSDMYAQILEAFPKAGIALL